MDNKELPYGTEVYDNYITIANTTKTHHGFYWCDATDNERGYFIGGGKLIILS